MVLHSGTAHSASAHRAAAAPAAAAALAAAAAASVVIGVLAAACPAAVAATAAGHATPQPNALFVCPAAPRRLRPRLPSGAPRACLAPSAALRRLCHQASLPDRNQVRRASPVNRAVPHQAGRAAAGPRALPRWRQQPPLAEPEVLQRTSHRAGLREGRRWAAAAAAAVAAAAAAGVAGARCTSVDECRELGDARFEESERQKGPIVTLGRGVRYREQQLGGGALVEKGAVVDISYEVRRANGDYLYSLGRGRPDARGDDFGETYRVRLGKQDVPLAVEMAMEGMRVGGIRIVEFPPQLGFRTSDWQPWPTDFSGKQRMERYKDRRSNNYLQRGLSSMLQFQVEVVRVRSPS